jgi:hypothetical protein
MSYVAAAIGGMTVFSQYSQGQQNKATGHAQAQALDYQAQQEQEASLQQAAIIRRAGRYQAASATAAFAGAGVRVDSGSAEEVGRQIDIDSEHDAMTAILNGTKRANALRTTGSFARIGGDLAATNANNAAIGSALSSGYKAYTGWVTANPASSPGDGLSQGERRAKGVF